MKQYKEGSDEYNNLDKQQTGNTVIQNAAYGFTNAKLGSFTKHTFLFLLGTITAIGRWLNRRMTRIVYDKFNGITVGGDTDSVFVQVKDATHQIQAKTTNHEEQMKQYFELCETIANTCSEGLPYPVKIGVDGIYMSLIISTRKKCYVAFEYSNPTSFKVKHQGVQYKKRDRAPFVRKNAAQIVELILYNKKQEVKSHQ
jgi:DNA polymerase elongation subunit (family B)